MAQKINLLMVNYEFPPIGGGAGKAHQCLLREYAHREDLRVDVVTSFCGRGVLIEHPAENITLHRVGIGKKNLHYWTKWEVMEWLVKSRKVYDRLLRENAYDLGHAFFAFPSGWLHYRSAGRLPYILSLRGSDVPGYNIRLGIDYKLLSGLFRRIWNGADAIVANSSGLARLAGQFAPNLSIQVIPNGVDTRQYFPAQEPVPRRPLQILSVCRLIRRKRICLSIHAVQKALEAGLDVHFHIAGEGNLLGSLRKTAEQLGLADRVHFLGRVEPERMPEVYRRSHLLLMTSKHEGMSNAMLEAMACGLPIVTTHCEGVDELVRDNGVVVEESSPEKIGQAILAIANDSSAYESMSGASRAAAEQFSWKTVADRYRLCYQQVLERKDRGAQSKEGGKG
jgi:glycosyltransferase involved in cell wall biosynthesis